MCLSKSLISEKLCRNQINICQNPVLVQPALVDALLWYGRGQSQTDEINVSGSGCKQQTRHKLTRVKSFTFSYIQNLD